MRTLLAGRKRPLLSIAAVGLGAVAALVLILSPRTDKPGTVLILLASSGHDQLSAVQLQVGADRVKVRGDAPLAPDTTSAAQLSLAPGDYPVRLGGWASSGTLSVRPGIVEPLLLAVSGGKVVPGGVYVGVESVNLGLQELSGHLRAIADFSLLDQAGQPLDRSVLLGSDTVIAAFHTTCHEACPLFTGLMAQIRRSAPGVRLLEVTTDPGTDSPAALAAYRTTIGADWTFATGTADHVAAFWAPLGVSLAVGDTHQSALILVDRHGYVRAAYTGIPDLGRSLPAPLSAQLDAAGRSLLAGHGEGWGAPQVIDSLRTLAAAGQASGGSAAPTFSLDQLSGGRLSLEELRGRPVLINFWWSGCPPCRAEMPLLQQFSDAHQDIGVLLVDPVDTAGAARAFVDSLKVHAPVLLDSDGRVAAAYHVIAYPTTFFLHPDGTVASSWPEQLSADQLRAGVSNLGVG